MKRGKEEKKRKRKRRMGGRESGRGREGEERKRGGRGEEEEEMVTTPLNGHPTAREWLGVGLDELLTGMHTPEVLLFHLQMRGIRTLSNF